LKTNTKNKQYFESLFGGPDEETINQKQIKKTVLDKYIEYIYIVLYCAILFDILSSMYSDILSSILSGIYSDILSGADIYSGILSGIYSDTLCGISHMARIHKFCFIFYSLRNLGQSCNNSSGQLAPKLHPYWVW